ncbi:N-acetylmuramidase family protein [Mangrovibrevibacter kandeliae]|uniref:N-acetylmuramidase family protein n=1 Tax=Mangrovibrevibacter kandeliae TaxID=2968473 RepID=UPI0021188981|nr:N-acetylmuramidase family protein [Aurantimonas sp. CSK15Z-1]MCQ8781739.1 N-acetylmuramidase family protein [Aurantimonas sp. CSK15Z-1]
MTDFRDFRGGAKPLDDIDLPRIGYRIKVGEDEIHAVMDVEAAGGAWDGQKRPKMLFEPHRFYKNVPPEKLAQAVAAGLAYKTWGEQPYPKDSYPRLVEAMKIDETAALKSASWGLGQILGENHAMVGYDAPQAMVLAFMEDAETHLDAMVSFIIAAHLDDELRAHNWAAFARGYNGPQYAKNAYHTKLAAAFAKWSKIRDTAWSPTMDAVPVPAPAPIASDVVAAVTETVKAAVQDAVPAVVQKLPEPIALPVPAVADPISVYNKVLGSLKGSTQGGGVFAAALLLAYKFDIVPEALKEPEAMAAVGVIGTWLFTTVMGAIKTYSAPKNAEASA